MNQVDQREKVVSYWRVRMVEESADETLMVIRLLLVSLSRCHLIRYSDCLIRLVQSRLLALFSIFYLTCFFSLSRRQ